MDFIDFDNIKVAFSVQGSGFPIVWLHGFGEDNRVWNEFIALFDKNQHILIDLPGLGASDVLVRSSVEKFAEVVHAILEKLDIKSAYLVGHSMGGYVGLAFAKKYPAYLKGLALFHSQPFTDTEEKKLNRLKSINFVKSNGTAPYMKQLIPVLFADSYRKENPTLIQQLIERASHYSPDGIIQCLQLMHDRPDSSVVLSQCDFPVCFIVGTEDKAVPNENSLNQLYLPAIADIHILEGIAHKGMFESTIETQKILSSFFHNFDS